MDVHPLLSSSQRKFDSLSVPEAVKYWQVSKLNVLAFLTKSVKGQMYFCSILWNQPALCHKNCLHEKKAALRYFPKCHLWMCINAGDCRACTSGLFFHFQQSRGNVRSVNPMLVVIHDVTLGVALCRTRTWTLVISVDLFQQRISCDSLERDEELWWEGPWLWVGSGGTYASSFKVLMEDLDLVIKKAEILFWEERIKCGHYMPDITQMPVCNRVTEMFRLEETFKADVVSSFCCGQGHLLLE